LGAAYQLSKTETLLAETAYSDRDVNLFSTIGNPENTAAALRLGYKNIGKKIRFMPDYQWFGDINLEIDQKNFNAIDRFRDIEFERDWSLRPDTLLPGEERIFSGTIGIQGASFSKENAKTDSSKTDSIKFEIQDSGVANLVNPNTSSTKSERLNDKLVYSFARRIRADNVNGYQQRLYFSKRLSKLNITASAFDLKVSQRFTASAWQRLRAEINYQMPLFTPGYIFESDKNKVTSLKKSDSVVATAMNFTAHTFYFRNADTLKTKFLLDYTYREDNFPVAGELVKNSFSQTANAQFSKIINENQSVAVTATYRRLYYLRNLTNFQNEETILGRLDWNGNFWDRNIRSELTYNIGTGRELKREFVFLPVPTGQGTHTWRDDNGDQVQQLTEFYEAINPDERNFVKFFTPTDQYIRAYTQNFNYRLNVNLPLAWRKEKGLKGLLVKFSGLFSWTILRKITNDDLTKRFLPFAEVADNQILSEQNTLRSVLFFNRTSPKLGADVNFLNTQQKQLLTNGFETRQSQEVRLNLRWNIFKTFNFRNSIAQLNRNNASDFLSNRNYRIESLQLNPELTFQPNADFRIGFNYLFAAKKNKLTEISPEQATINQIGSEIRWNKVSKRSIQATVNYILIDFKNGVVESPVGYELLEALRPGVNWNWNINWQQKLANGLQLNLIYEGRQSESQRLIQLGKVQVSALF
ncbi:MAG: hypothetical protein H7Y04_10630, partial [Verrucomicrobia bacterium]|nr:hypothetical protein [Cytophagales bacterium]